MTTSFPGFPETTHDNKVLPPPLRSSICPNSNSSSPPFTTHSRIALPLFLSSPIPPSITSLSGPSSHNSPLPKPYRRPTSTSHLSSAKPSRRPSVPSPTPFLSSSPHAPLSSDPQSPNLLSTPQPPHLFRTHSVPPPLSPTILFVPPRINNRY